MIVGGKTYYLDPTTGEMKNGWMNLNNKWYYLGFKWCNAKRMVKLKWKMVLLSLQKDKW